MSGEKGLAHFLVPKHTKATKEEVEEFLNKYNIELYQLPKIKKTDPAIKHLDVSVGDVIKIERKSLSSEGSYIIYRLVIE